MYQGNGRETWKEAPLLVPKLVLPVPGDDDDGQTCLNEAAMSLSFISEVLPPRGGRVR